jgi:hypothetical protein
MKIMLLAVQHWYYIQFGLINNLHIELFNYDSKWKRYEGGKDLVIFR